MSVKVSVIVPTYNTDPVRLAALVDSIRGQSMKPEDYEVIFVDDGSTSGIYAEIQQLTRRYDNFTSERIANSGWACRPRNVGVRLAQGEFVLFMDHDDVLFPEGLARSYAYGHENSADVVNHKEIRTDGWAWSWGRFLKDVPEAQPQGISCLIPMTPHKLYRRTFLTEHGIEFDEGSRVLWEDVYFNTRVFSHGPRVSVLANYPVYHWANTGENTSSTFSRDPNERWTQLQKLMRFFHETLPPGKDLDYLVEHWYKSRVLGLIGGALEKKSDERIETELALGRDSARQNVRANIIAKLAPIDRVKQAIIDRGDVGLARQFAQSQAQVSAQTHTTDAWWSGSELCFSARTTLMGGDSQPLELVETGDGVEREIDRPFEALFGAQGREFKQAVSKASYVVSLKARTTREIWALPGTGTVTLEPRSEGGSQLVGEITAHVDLLTAAFGQPLTNQPWEVGARLSALGKTHHRGIVVGEPGGLLIGALISGRAAVAYQNKSGALSIDVGSGIKSVINTARLTSADAQVHRQPGGMDIVIQLPGVHVFGITDIPGFISLQPGVKDGVHWKAHAEPAIRIDASLVGDADGARVVARTADFPPGYYRVSTNFQARETDTAIVVDTILRGPSPTDRSAQESASS